MITINNKSRYFSASEDMFPTMERNFAWLFGMQTPEQGWKAAMAKAIYRSARASSAEEWQYGFPIGAPGHDEAAFPPQTHQGVLRDPPRQRDEREPR